MALSQDSVGSVTSQVHKMTLARSDVSEEDSRLIEELHALSQKSPKLVRSSEYTAPADPSIVIRSWKMNEFKYYDVPSPFPTLARGLFTQEVEVDGKTKHRIVARGYDKFFNIGEVPWTQWDSLESYTQPPYTLTLKSNGCIIFIAALTPSQLVITSKHALGPAKGEEKEKGSHAEAGERWLRKHLSDVGKTEKELASTLWEKNWTAIAELCDDSFEEHVLPYGPDKTGLHLHGLNACSRAFATQPQDVVDAFANEWGFIETRSTVLNSIADVRSFTEQIGRTGKWDGEALEGFVVRTHVGSTKSNKALSASPYAPGSSFFFKVKFDEPYMMYRDWREVTKILLSKGPSSGNVPKGKLRRPETKVYVKWVCAEIKRDRSQFEEFNKGKGIIATRERFLKWMESEEGKGETKRMGDMLEEKGLNPQDEKQFGKTIIVPIAVPGVGKTSIAVALCHLFGFGHTQSDDVQGKKSAPRFIKNVQELLNTHDVVIADKNNHLRQHRQQLRDVVRGMSPPVRLLALNWSFDVPLSTIHRICGDRVLERGANHQSLIASTKSKEHEDIIWQFIRNAEELEDGEVDVAVEMDWEESLEDALTRAADACVRILGLPKPDQEQMGMALAVTRSYAPKTTAKPKLAPKEEEVSSGKKKKENPPRYYGLVAEIDLPLALREVFKEDDTPKSGKEFWEALSSSDRVAQHPHVTLVHERTIAGAKPGSEEHKEAQALWDRCAGLHAVEVPPQFNFRLSHLVWNDRVMAAVVEDLAVEGTGNGTKPEVEGIDFVSKLPQEYREALHVTVGTRDKSIRPVEARALVKEWKKAKDDDRVKSLPLEGMWVKGRVKGLVQ
ncbi:hypothetical protein WOLCODRAFT_139122 [Wolfiporia cocos MD-104 SS10]|uniref:tRNA ligase n=1 Tax=Wolfiporia cocos (strain MD-104) TaxID=742152 RepID=A0A2H3K0F4_WOLCO|nr:hypothetical protein WOLCODRAFT_139122 [Wolfiporia cocos MD-104 SS10]